jgi:uncharacterized protein YjbJ (UPF0337 family)
MSDQRISDAAKKVRGSITEALGKLTGEKGIEDKGTVQKRAAEANIKATETKTDKAKETSKQ